MHENIEPKPNIIKETWLFLPLHIWILRDFVGTF